MQLTTIFTTIALLSAQASAACSRLSTAQGEALSVVEVCRPEANRSGRFLCPKTNAWFRLGGNWGTRAFSPDNDVIFRIEPLTETGNLAAIYVACPAGTDNEFVMTGEGTSGVGAASVVA
ncbi:hypothetical protein FZEAL_5168 [Fusarium zealandicum]|uniref:Uncharacterized protein n=1 Tax=Fusarium zealandicum TaxID=1053134 RepID=A0A8H4XL57_9HYPO|nr:hypothetical protein FZEAL_5168 [Fusarium zealandicum]